MLPRSSKFLFLNNLDLDLQNSILNHLRIIWTFSSNALEGNKLTLEDTRLIIEKGGTISSKIIKEHNEVLGHISAIDTLYSILDNDELRKEDLFLLYNAIHTNVSTNVSHDAWKRTLDGKKITIEEREKNEKQIPEFEAVPYLMEIWLKTFGKFRQMRTWEEIIEHCAAMHLSFSSIKPFYDENDRIIRLICNYPLLMAGFPPIIFTLKKRDQYHKILSSYRTTSPRLTSKSKEIYDANNKHFKEFVALCKEESHQIQNIIESTREKQFVRSDLAIEELEKNILRLALSE